MPKTPKNIDIIQYRIVTLYPGHPLAWKWLWSGATVKTLRPVVFLESI